MEGREGIVVGKVEEEEEGSGEGHGRKRRGREGRGQGGHSHREQQPAIPSLGRGSELVSYSVLSGPVSGEGVPAHRSTQRSVSEAGDPLRATAIFSGLTVDK